jgi:hypothetical protein
VNQLDRADVHDIITNPIDVGTGPVSQVILHDRGSPESRGGSKSAASVLKEVIRNLRDALPAQ